MSSKQESAMSITDEQLAELEQVAGKATKGEWWIDSHGHNMVSFTDGGTVPVFSAQDLVNPAVRHPETGNLSHWPNDWDASYIVTAQPRTIAALITRLRTAEAERDELRKDAERYRWLRASMWYVGPDTLEPTEGGGIDGYANENFMAENLDAAIDAAMEASQ